MKLKNEILKDYEQYCYQKLLSEFGCYKSTNQTAMKLYHRYKYRILNAHPREIIEQSNIVISEEHLSAYKRIISDITQGNALKKYQSRKLKSLDYNDDMLSHWGIQHFHLGNTLDEDGFIKRTSDLLFIHFTDTQAHIIGLFTHNNWCDLDIIERIHQNWPEILSKYKASSVKTPPTEEQYKILRKKNANTSIVLQDGTEYFPPGLGVMCDGSPIAATLNLQKLINIFEKAFNDISLNINQILDSDVEKRKTDIVTIGLELDEVHRKLVYKIKETGHRFTLNY